MAFSMGILFGLLAMIGFGLGNALAANNSRKEGYVKTIFYRNILAVALLLIPVLIFNHHITLKSVLLAISIAIVGYFPLLTFYKSLTLERVGVVTPIANSSTVFTVLFSILFFKETLTLSRILFIVSIIVGIILLSLNAKDFKNAFSQHHTTAILLALTACFLWGVVHFLFKIPVTLMGPILTSFITELVILIVSAIHLRIQKQSFFVKDKKLLLSLIGVGFFSGLASISYMMGLSYSDVIVIAPLISSSPLIALLYARIVHKEQLHLQQYIGFFFVLLGIILLSLS